MATIKQKKAFDNIVENGGNISKGMIDAKYSPNTAKTPQKLTESKGWIELMDEYIPDKELVKIHKEGLKANRKIFKNNNETGEIEMVSEEPDFAIRHKYLDSAYKIKGSYAPEKSATVNVNINKDKNDNPEKLKAIIKKVITEMKENE